MRYQHDCTIHPDFWAVGAPPAGEFSHIGSFCHGTLLLACITNTFSHHKLVAFLELSSTTRWYSFELILLSQIVILLICHLNANLTLVEVQIWDSVATDAEITLTSWIFSIYLSRCRFGPGPRIGEVQSWPIWKQLTLLLSVSNLLGNKTP